MTDVRLYHTADGGEIDYVNGQPTMADGIETAVYLSLFGGNEEDSGVDDDRKQWWANYGEPDPARRYRSTTQFLVRSLPAIPYNLKRIEDAAMSDLAWFTESGLATLLRVAVTMPGLNKIQIVVELEIDGRVIDPIKILESWNVSA